MAFELPKLPYSFDALEPHIDARTMEIHHGKHHAAYVANVNKALEGHGDLQTRSITELISDLASVPQEIRTAVRNNGGGHFNHSLFWNVMKAGGGGAPEEAGPRQPVRVAPKVGRNAPCPCGSGRKHKQCCGSN